MAVLPHPLLLLTYITFTMPVLKKKRKKRKSMLGQFNEKGSFMHVIAYAISHYVRRLVPTLEREGQ